MITPIRATYKTQDFRTGKNIEEEVQILQFVMVPTIGTLRSSDIHAVYLRKTPWGHVVLENRHIREFRILTTIEDIKN